MFARAISRPVIQLPFIIAVSVLAGCTTTETKKPEQVAALPPEPGAVSTASDFRFEDYRDLEVLFLERGYTPETWKDGSRAVPRLYLTNIPERYRKSVSKRISVATKKRVFFRLMAPLFLRSNEMILEQRATVERLVQKTRGNQSLTTVDRTVLDTLAQEYLPYAVTEANISVALEDLLIRVDIVPLSLALAQAAEESGWGTSRFADVGNALFGQWTYSGKGITPQQKRKSKGDYKIAAFDTVLDSVRAYMLNLNTHLAYGDFRRLRASIRARSDQLTGSALVPGLLKYSERGEDYIRSLEAIMRVNKLAAADKAYLEAGPRVNLIPIGEGAD